MATLPDFQRVSQCYATLAKEMTLIENFPTINNEAMANQRHEELLNLLKTMNTRLDQQAQDTETLKEGRAALEEGQAALKEGQDTLKTLIFAK